MPSFFHLGLALVADKSIDVSKPSASPKDRAGTVDEPAAVGHRWSLHMDGLWTANQTALPEVWSTPVGVKPGKVTQVKAVPGAV
jgi:hypothetical protein